MRILITGGMGHVGFETVRSALARGHDVVAQYRSVFREADAAALGERVTWIRCDLAEAEQVAALLAHPVDGCIHTAAVPNEQFARGDPLGTIDANVVAVARLLEAARTRGWRRFLYTSTGSVFQNATDVSRPILEDATPSVTNVYSTTKYAGELLTAMYRSQFDVPAATVRVSWVYGPPLVPRVRQNPRGPIPVFLKLALAGQPVREPSGRDFGATYTYVADVAAGLLAAFEADTLRHATYHLSCGRNILTDEVAAAVRAAVPGAILEVGPGTAPWTDHTRMRGPLAGQRLLEDTGFAPRYTIEQGVAAFAEWMRAHPESYRD
ncbi:MAG TPA: NAD(P)-dependent oxidoreductase [Casimicrobiaceae bacterium]|nr:NAD(P)-dependent oxidoreductase [Casimicrobiaceae bacterium]